MIADPARGQSSAAPVVLKKYGNRRLYDTNASKYVTLHDLEEMVQRGTDVQVLDAKTGDDLTKEVLVQIILDKDSAREMLPTSFLKQVVRLSSSPLKETFSRVLQDSLDGFLSNQRALVDAQRNLLTQFVPQGFNPFSAFAPPAPSLQYPTLQQQQQQQQMQQQMAQQQPRDTEVDRLRVEMSETQALLRQLIAEKAAPQPEKRARKKK